MADEQEQHKRQWRDYRTASGARPVKEFLDSLSDKDATAVADEMKRIAREGLVRARHVRGEIYEVREGR